MSHKITITLVTENDAFEPAEECEAYEVARILKELVKNINEIGDIAGFDGKRLLDLNGNRVGTVKVEPC